MWGWGEGGVAHGYTLYTRGRMLFSPGDMDALGETQVTRTCVPRGRRERRRAILRHVSSDYFMSLSAVFDCEDGAILAMTWSILLCLLKYRSCGMGLYPAKRELIWLSSYFDGKGSKKIAHVTRFRTFYLFRSGVEDIVYLKMVVRTTIGIESKTVVRTTMVAA